MISHVIKRNGQTMPFEPAKLNGWGIWASHELKHVDWVGAVLHVVGTSPSVVSSKDLQNSLIDYCLTIPSWEYHRMAGRLYISLLYKQIYDDKIPTIRQVHKNLVQAELMDPAFYNSYSYEDYKALEKIIDHSADLAMAHYQIKQSMNKYSLMDRVDNVYYETPQFTLMRVAMRMCQNKGKGAKRIARIKRHYQAYIKANIPTPYLTNSGTKQSGFISCCLHVNDDNLGSLAAANHISYMMTATSAGIGSKSRTRAEGDKVRGGSISHAGRINYNRAEVAMINANMQNGRGGAETQYFDCIDMEALAIIPMKNPMTPLARQVRGLDYGFCFNKHFADYAARSAEYCLFSYKDHPELFDGLCDKDPNRYYALYDAAVAGKSRRVNINARELLHKVLGQSVEVGQMYTSNLTELNIHTPFKEAIQQSNLCAEIALVTKPYKSVVELYKNHYDEGDGEVATCAIGGISVGLIESEEDYANVAWVILDMIHTAITETTFPFPQVAFTSRQRMSAGVGISDLAHLMAKNNKNFYDQEGRDFIHQVSERHYWHLLNASLELSKEFGNAPWMHKTEWPNGWLPIDTYNKNVDELVTVPLQYDWESKRQEVIANGGHAFSVLVASMPAEQSSIRAGTTNGPYPVRDIDLKKTNDQDNFDYVVPESDLYREAYARNLSWDIDVERMIDGYAIMQKWHDQSISADLWYKVVGVKKIRSHDLCRGFFRMVKYGVPNRYYLNSYTGKGKALNEVNIVVGEVEPVQAECEGCKL